MVAGKFQSTPPRKGRHGGPFDWFRNLWNSINARWRKVYQRIDGKRELVGFECYPWAEEDAPPVSARARRLGLPCRIIANPWAWAIKFRRIDAR